MGYSQVEGVDYTKVFAPTTKLKTLCLVLSIMALRKWSGRQVDINTAFLNGHLDEPVYMSQPPGYEDLDHPDWVCEVSRLIYGLKQSPRQWNVELHAALLSLGLQQSSYDCTLYFLLENGKLLGLITVHVDDLSVIGPDSFVNSFISALGSKFEIFSDNKLHHFLSLNITCDYSNCLVFVNQSHYIKELGPRFLPSGHVTTHTPTDSAFKNLCP